jgi:hypothetical protein
MKIELKKGDAVLIPKVKNSLANMVSFGYVLWLSKDGRFCKVRVRYGAIYKSLSFRTDSLEKM